MRALAVRRRYDVRVHGAERVPATGPVIFAANHVGIIDGPLLAVSRPRPVHALTKQEMFDGRLGGFLRRAGQIPLDRFARRPGRHPDLRCGCCATGERSASSPRAPAAAASCDRFHHGAAYLALVTGAPVVPVILLGTREPGGGISSAARRGGAHRHRLRRSRGRSTPQPWPRTQGMVRGHVGVAAGAPAGDAGRARRSLTGRDLPGPLPAGTAEDDPDTGLVDEEHQTSREPT